MKDYMISTSSMDSWREGQAPCKEVEGTVPMKLLGLHRGCIESIPADRSSSFLTEARASTSAPRILTLRCGCSPHLLGTSVEPRGVQFPWISWQWPWQLSIWSQVSLMLYALTCLYGELHLPIFPFSAWEMTYIDGNRSAFSFGNGISDGHRF